MPYERKRILIEKPRGYGNLRMDHSPIADPSADETQVEIRACGINFADTIVRRGLYAAAKGRYPICPGFEFSGVVKELGIREADFQRGDRVFGVTRFGGYSTIINSPSQFLWRLPEHWDFAKGATFPVVYLTAYYALFHAGNLSGNDSVLVHSAAGGVGTALLHLLKANGNRTVGVVSHPEKVAIAQRSGATAGINKRFQDLWKTSRRLHPEGYDLILDANGASTLADSYKHLRPRGRLVVYGFASMLSRKGGTNYPKLLWTYLRTPRFNPLDLTLNNKTVAGFNLVFLFDKIDLFRQIMKGLLRLDTEGLLPDIPVKAYPFNEVLTAHKEIESGKSIGKLALIV
jgi:NADPH:quinone reductase-like Zn-dependent oxidoreductase